MRRKGRAARVPALAVQAAPARVVQDAALAADRVSRRVRGSASIRMATRATHRASPPITPTRVSARTVRHALLVARAVGVRVRVVIAAPRRPTVAPAVPVVAGAVRAAQAAHRAAPAAVRRAAAIVVLPAAVIAVVDRQPIHAIKTAPKRAVFCDGRHGASTETETLPRIRRCSRLTKATSLRRYRDAWAARTGPGGHDLDAAI
ncbi:hypothetical protein XAP6164_4670007 [Xanthomonas phaseoli pv. phaseoli]|nr:hypothetical protein XAP6164_4670007 [Xanthomonas phaseoli pv. phaseoli]